MSSASVMTLALGGEEVGGEMLRSLVGAPVGGERRVAVSDGGVGG